VKRPVVNEGAHCTQDRQVEVHRMSLSGTYTVEGQLCT
jgi:hypothetical protein